MTGSNMKIQHAIKNAVRKAGYDNYENITC